MEMRAMEDIDDIAQDLTPPLPPLAFSLHDCSLLSHCSACFSPISPPPHPHRHHVPTHSYCSPHCSTSHSHLHLSSAEHHFLLLLLLRHPSTSHLTGTDTSDLRAALRLLLSFEKSGFVSRQNDYVPARIAGLMTNHERLLCRENDDEDEILARIRDGAKAMAVARRMRDGLDMEFSAAECVVEEAVLCLVLTNAVEVQVNGGRTVGIAVYDTTFSWINHSCSPNACYRFFPPQSSGAEPWSQIAPATTGGGCEIELAKDGVGNKCKPTKGWEGYGPRISVRNIKAIKKGEEVSIAYIDLLQPKAKRRSELWLKYRFICCCSRCSALPSTYVDHALQEISTVNLDSADFTSDYTFIKDNAIKKLNDYIDDAIAEYLSCGNADSCCAKLESMLTHGLPDEQPEPRQEKSQQKFKLHPLHHLSLSAYTTLASAYKIRASELLALGAEMNEHQLEAFDMSRTSAAYSLLLAGATHHLFIFESSLIASVANFWIGAGESLLHLARRSVWNVFLKVGSTVPELPCFPSPKCSRCALMDKLGVNFVSNQDKNTKLEDTSREFLNCITNITPKIWSFLIHEGSYLKGVEDPIKFNWLETKKSLQILDFKVDSRSIDRETSVVICELQECADHERINLFQLGVHCILYGGFLSSIYRGHDSNLTCHIQNLLYCE